MTDSVLARVAALKTTSTPELKQQWRDLFGKEPPPFNRRYIESRLARQIGIEQRVPITQRLLGTRRAALALQTSPDASLAPIAGMAKS